MVHWLASWITVLAVSLGSGVHAQDSAAALALLQGPWVVTGGEHNGNPMDTIKGGVLTIAGDTFEIHSSRGDIFKGTLRIDAITQPSQMDMMHADGTRWEAIYEVQGDSLRLNYVEADGKDPRPVAFTTSENGEESIVTLRRESR